MIYKKQKTGTLYGYLDATGVLENGSHSDIQNAKKAYWKVYKREWRKKKKENSKPITVWLTRTEFACIATTAVEHKRSKPTFVKEACFAYIRKRFLVPDVLAVNEIRQLLALYYNALEKLLDEATISYDLTRRLQEQLLSLEQRILQELCNPKEAKDDH